MEFNNDKLMVTMAILTCRHCGEKHERDVNGIHMPVRDLGVFKATCPHCGSSQWYHINSADFEIRYVSNVHMEDI